MPETNELQAHYETAEHYRENVLEPEDDLEIFGAWCDSTGEEDEDESLHHPKDDHVFKMGPDDHFIRGNQSSQTLVAPEETLRPSGSMETPPTIGELGLRWKATHGDGRALYLDFGDMFLKVWRCLNICVPQITHYSTLQDRTSYSHIPAMLYPSHMGK